ncbi:MAG: AMP-binding protein, partial [Candidatus Dormibacteraeota bacterium]|nr:AMP-binding protein [Candidatus Dormibacteraeota bacterium]
MDGVYDRRPWLSRYSPWVPADLEPPAPSALEMFRRAAAERPEAPALHYLGATMSFGELDRQSSSLAAALADRGLERGDRVGVYLQNVPQFPIATLATWKLGGIVVPLNPMLKGQEVSYQLSDSGARGLVCLESLYESVARDVIPETPVRAVVTTCELDYLGGTPPNALLAAVEKRRPAGTEDLVELASGFDGASPPDPGLDLDDVAFLTYTSGTTGRPKGAMNTHRNVAFNAEVYRTWMRIGPGDVILAAAPLFHITGLIGHLALSFLAGIPMVLFHRFEAEEALRQIERRRCTFTVASITAFMAMAEAEGIRSRDLSSLRKAYSGGAPIAPATVERFERLTGVYIHNIYGLTETTSPSHATPLGQR